MTQLGGGMIGTIFFQTLQNNVCYISQSWYNSSPLIQAWIFFFCCIRVLSIITIKNDMKRCRDNTNMVY